MIVKEIDDIKDIALVLSDNDIFDRLSSDLSQPIGVDNIPISDKYKYIAGYVGDDIIGLCIYCHKEKETVIHFQVLPKYRAKYARKFAVESLEFRGDLPLYAITPKCYAPVINFALNVGFKKLGFHATVFIKNGVSYKQQIMRFCQ